MTQPAAPIDDLVVLALADEAAAADEAWAVAARRYQLAPHGERESRQRAAQDASQAALKARLAVAAAAKAVRR